MSNTVYDIKIGGNRFLLDLENQSHFVIEGETPTVIPSSFTSFRKEEGNGGNGSGEVEPTEPETPITESEKEFKEKLLTELNTQANDSPPDIIAQINSVLETHVSSPNSFKGENVTQRYVALEAQNTANGVTFVNAAVFLATVREDGIGAPAKNKILEKGNALIGKRQGVSLLGVLPLSYNLGDSTNTQIPLSVGKLFKLTNNLIRNTNYEPASEEVQG